jgi:hypothetical protein
MKITFYIVHYKNMFSIFCPNTLGIPEIYERWRSSLLLDKFVNTSGRVANFQDISRFNFPRVDAGEIRRNWWVNTPQGVANLLNIWALEEM